RTRLPHPCCQAARGRRRRQPGRPQRGPRHARTDRRARPRAATADAPRRAHRRRGRRRARQGGRARTGRTGHPHPARPPAPGWLHHVLQHGRPRAVRHAHGAGGAMSSFSLHDRRGRVAVVAILLIFALSSTVAVVLSIRATTRARTHASVLQIAGRQQTLAGRYVASVMLAPGGAAADPETIAQILADSNRALLDGGTAPEVAGNDDETNVTGTSDPVARRQLIQEGRLIADMAATGRAILAGRPASSVRA